MAKIVLKTGSRSTSVSRLSIRAAVSELTAARNQLTGILSPKSGLTSKGNALKPSKNSTRKNGVSPKRITK